MFGINQLRYDQNTQYSQKYRPQTLQGVGASVAVSTGLLTLVVIGGIAYLILK